MRVQIVTNLDNGAGLQQDCRLLAALFTLAGHTVWGVHIHRPEQTMAPADLNIFLEVLRPEVLHLAPRNWMVPNCEWWGGYWNMHIPRLDRILCKTADCLRIWKGKTAPERCTLTGWAAQDLYQPDVPKEPKFLHTAGKSLTKNTAALMEAWTRYKIPYPLTVSAFKPEIARLCRGIPNVRLVERFTNEELQHEVNSSRFFLMPSKYEGYGHAIHEALGCRAVVLTTNGEPMCSFSGVYRGLCIPTVERVGMADATAHLVSVQGIWAAVKNAANYPAETLEHIGDQARAGFLKDNAFFMDTIKGLIDGI